MLSHSSLFIDERDQNQPVASQFGSVYYEYFKSVEDKIEAFHSKLNGAQPAPQKGIQLKDVPKGNSIRLVSIENGGAVLTFEVWVGYFRTRLIILSINHEAQQDIADVVANGAFGSVLKTAFSGQPSICKRIYFQTKTKLGRPDDNAECQLAGSHKEIDDFIYEVAINKISWWLGVGPKVGAGHCFDMVCFRNCMEFYMQKCQPVGDLPKQALKGLEERLKYCVRLLHTFRIVHKDLKPSNIMFSPSLGNFVLIDFGISQFTQREPGEMSFTYREGTPKYMSPELFCLKKGVLGMADLYYNDMHCLQLTTAAFTEKTEPKHKRSKNPPPVSEICQPKKTHQMVTIASALYEGQYSLEQKNELDLNCLKASFCKYPHWHWGPLFRFLGFGPLLFFFLRICPGKEQAEVTLKSLRLRQRRLNQPSLRKLALLAEDNFLFKQKVAEAIRKLEDFNGKDSDTEDVSDFDEIIKQLVEHNQEADETMMLGKFQIALGLIYSPNEAEVLSIIRSSRPEHQLELIQISGMIYYERNMCGAAQVIFQQLDSSIQIDSTEEMQYNVVYFLVEFFTRQFRDTKKLSMKKLLAFVMGELALMGNEETLINLCNIYKKSTDRQILDLIYHQLSYSETRVQTMNQGILKILTNRNSFSDPLRDEININIPISVFQFVKPLIRKKEDEYCFFSTTIDKLVQECQAKSITEQQTQQKLRHLYFEWAREIDNSKVVYSWSTLHRICAVIRNSQYNRLYRRPDEAQELMLLCLPKVVKWKHLMPPEIQLDFHATLASSLARCKGDLSILTECFVQIQEILQKRTLNQKQSKHGFDVLSSAAFELYEQKQIELALHCARLCANRRCSCQFLIGVCLYWQHEYRKSMEAFQQYQTHPDCSASHNFAVSCKLMSKIHQLNHNIKSSDESLAKAKQTYQNLLQTKPRNHFLLRRLAQIHQELGENNQMLTCLKKIAVLRKDDLEDLELAESVAQLGVNYFKMQLYRKASVFLKISLKVRCLSRIKKNKIFNYLCLSLFHMKDNLAMQRLILHGNYEIKQSTKAVLKDFLEKQTWVPQSNSTLHIELVKQSRQKRTKLFFSVKKALYLSYDDFI